jgi:hypothetical protein
MRLMIEKAFRKKLTRYQEYMTRKYLLSLVLADVTVNRSHYKCNETIKIGHESWKSEDWR